MKKLIILLLVLMAAVFSVNADTDDADNDKTATLTIKAYKKSKSDTGAVLTVKVIDALTRSLDDIFNTEGVNNAIIINKYVDKFVGTRDNNPTGISKKAIFSVHVAGNMKGKFSVTATFKPLAEYTNVSDPTTYSQDAIDKQKVMMNNTYKYWQKSSTATVIPVTYYMRDINYFFTSSGTATSGAYTIKCDTAEANAPVEDNSSIGELKFEWTVYDTSKSTSGTTSGNYWDIETMFAMIIDETAYNNFKGSGTFLAPIEIVIASET